MRREGPVLAEKDRGAVSAPDYPDIKVELYSESGMRNIVEKRFDAGVRLGRREIAPTTCCGVTSPAATLEPTALPQAQRTPTTARRSG